ncbi:hypothetical protein KJ762_10455 [bacterium]|nr:hypothetical protein [bacterium]MBU1873262.1 hypothetical protein [bacterium]
MNKTGLKNHLSHRKDISRYLHPHRTSDIGGNREANEIFLKNREDEKSEKSGGT